MCFLRRLRCPGSCFGVDSLGIGWGFDVLESCFLGSFLCNSLRLGPCSYLYSLEPGCYSSSEGRSTSCIVGRFVLEDEGCSIEGAVAEGRKLRYFCFLQIRFGVILSSGH